jgi:type I restriction enzyme, S subunit
MSELPSGWISEALGKLTTVRNEKKSPKEIPELPFIGLEEVEAHTGKIICIKTTSGLKSSVAIFEEGELHPVPKTPS